MFFKNLLFLACFWQIGYMTLHLDGFLPFAFKAAALLAAFIRPRIK
ncbi:hypothetical protein RINTU1_11870 [Candidatus Regiella insecticola]|uniref:Uncharacterized protein n=1 Tax=Candidatus Regiella insecticola TaxID=138073 RepID=A0A6L2ZLX3_9ENTR|nr:hypothetical protein RINTU1_11870 [Candidatus Regiella insecticola]